MKKITFAAVAVLTLLLTGCSQQEADTDQSQEQSTEQVSSSSKVSTSSTSSSDVLQGRSAYDVFIVLDANAKVIAQEHDGKMILDK